MLSHRWKAAVLITLPIVLFLIVRKVASSRPIILSELKGGHVAFSGDGVHLVCGGADTQSNALVQVVEVASRSIVQSVTSEGYRTSSVAMSPNASLVAAGIKGASWPDEKLPIKIWDVKTGKLLHVLDNVSGTGAKTLVFSPDGKTLCSVRSSAVTLWDTTKNFQEIRTLQVSPTLNAYSMGFNGQAIVVGGTQGVWAYDLKRQQSLPAPALGGGSIYAVALSPDGTLSAAGGQDAIITVWETQSGKVRMKVPQPSSGSVGALALSADNSTLVSSGTGGVLLWQIGSQNPYRKLSDRGASGDGQFLSISPDGSMLVASDYVGPVVLYKL